MIAIVDYGMGNLHSVSKALETVGASVTVTSKADDIRRADKIVLPGVGSFAQGMAHLKSLHLIDALNEQVIGKRKPFLGICLGLQLAAEEGEEHGPTQGLGWLKGKVIRLNAADRSVKVPHMGWNDVEVVSEQPLFTNIKNLTSFYFVHSYHFVVEEPDCVAARCEHGITFTAAISKGNIHLVQFHPEKSQSVGLQVLENFLRNT